MSTLFLESAPAEQVGISPAAGRTYFAVDDSWETYQTTIRSLLEAEGATLVNAIDWFSDDGKYFVDNLHLTKTGAEEFSRRLAPIVAVESGPPPAR